MRFLLVIIVLAIVFSAGAALQAYWDKEEERW